MAERNRKRRTFALYAIEHVPANARECRHERSKHGHFDEPHAKQIPRAVMVMKVAIRARSGFEAHISRVLVLEVTQALFPVSISRHIITLALGVTPSHHRSHPLSYTHISTPSLSTHAIVLYQGQI